MTQNSPEKGAHDGNNAEPSEAEVRDALARVVASDAFVASARLQQFLTYVVEEALAGRGSAIKGKTIAAEVYERDLEDFEAGQNLVRVEARRLRRHLAEYYGGPGTSDLWQIHIDLGGYAPRFVAAGQEAQPVAEEQSRYQGESKRNRSILAVGGVALVAAIVIAVFALRPGPIEPGSSAGEASRTALRMRSVPALQAVNMAEQARGMFFPIFDGKRQELALEMYQHAISLDPELHHGYAGAAQVLATLALLATDHEAASDLRDQASQMSEKALELSPEEAWPHAANAWVLSVSGDVHNAMNHARLAVELAPQDGHILDLAGITAAVANAPEFAAETSDPERARSGLGRFGANNIWGVSQYMLGNYEVTIEAFGGAAQSGAPMSAPSLVFLAVAYSHLGQDDEAARLVEEFNNTFEDFPTEFIVGRIFQNEPAFAADVLDRLEKHGLQKQ